jgi:hypothetical protein
VTCISYPAKILASTHDIHNIGNNDVAYLNTIELTETTSTMIFVTMYWAKNKQPVPVAARSEE